MEVLIVAFWCSPKWKLIFMEGLLDSVYPGGPQRVLNIFSISLFCWDVSKELIS